MRTSALNEIKERLQHDFGSPQAEWEFLEPLLKANVPDRDSILKWVFSKSPAYWDTRARAGLILLQENESETWSTIETLIASANPDDNGTVLTMFELTRDPRGPEIAKRWLTDDVHPATQIEAANFLKEIYPDEVLTRLQSLANHKDKNIQNSAKQIMKNWDLS